MAKELSEMFGADAVKTGSKLSENSQLKLISKLNQIAAKLTFSLIFSSAHVGLRRGGARTVEAQERRVPERDRKGQGILTGTEI